MESFVIDTARQLPLNLTGSILCVESDFHSVPDNYPSDWSTRRKEVYRRDNFTCQNCKRVGGQNSDLELHAHHIVPIHSGGTHSKSNLKTLCRNCHTAIHSEGTAIHSEETEINPFVNIDTFENCPICNSHNDFGIVPDCMVQPNASVAKCVECETEFSMNGTSGFLPRAKLEISESNLDIKGYEINPVILKNMEGETIENANELEQYVENSGNFLKQLRRVTVAIILIMILSLIIGLLIRKILISLFIVFTTMIAGFIIVGYIDKQARS